MVHACAAVELLLVRLEVYEHILWPFADAEAILDEQGHTYQTADIADDLELMERYGVRIPVVRDAAGRELGWPFDGTQLRQFLSAD